MARGGKRDGAGRKAGSINKASAAKRAEIAASGLTPLDYMLMVMRDELIAPDRRDDMAKAAAPYVHSRLAAIEHSGEVGLTHTLSDLSDEQLAAIATGGGARAAGKARGAK